VKEDGCPACGSDLRGDPIDPKHFVHHVEDDPTWDRAVHTSHEKQLEMWGRCHCLPYGDKPEGERFFSRKMGYEVSGIYDGILIWGCEDCGHKWPRFAPDAQSGYSRLHDKAVEIIERWKREKEMLDA